MINGIVLISLIVTIIVIIILVYTTLNSFIKGGITGNYESKNSSKLLNIGDYIDYAPDKAADYINLGTSDFSDMNPSGSSHNSMDGIPQDTTLNWRVFNINDDGSVDLIADKPINSDIFFKGALGFNNGVYLLNNLCSTHYTNGRLCALARSINLEDIEKHMNHNGISKRNSDIFNALHYGDSKSYTGSNSYTPDIYLYAKGDSDNYYTSLTNHTYLSKSENPNGSNLDIIQSYYSIEFQENDFDDPNFYHLVFDTEISYWLATRYACSTANYADFGLQRVSSNFNESFTGASLFYSNNSLDEGSASVRPVVRLPSFTKFSETGGSIDNPRKIL